MERFLVVLDQHCQGDSTQFLQFVETILESNDPGLLCSLIKSGIESVTTPRELSNLLATALGLFIRIREAMAPEARIEIVNFLLDRMAKFVDNNLDPMVFEVISVLADDDLRLQLLNDPRAEPILLELLLLCVVDETCSKFANEIQKLKQIVHKELCENGPLNESNPRFSKIASAMTLLARLITLFGNSGFEEECAVVLEYVKQSVTLKEQKFDQFWRIMTLLVNSFDEEQLFALQFVEVVFQACEMNVPAEMKVVCLNALSGNLTVFEKSLVHQILRLSLRIASEYIDQARLLPTEFMFLYEHGFDIFEHQALCDFARKEIVKYKDTGYLALSLLVMREMLDNAPEICYKEVGLMKEMLEKALTGGNALEIEAACLVLAMCDKVFVTVVDVHHWACLAIPHVQDTNQNVSEAAINAVGQMIKIAPLPLPDIVPKVFHCCLCGKVVTERMFMLLALAIENQSILDDDTADLFMRFSLDLMRSPSENAIICGIVIGVALLDVNESVRFELVPMLDACLKKVADTNDLGSVVLITAIISRLTRSWEARVAYFGIHVYDAIERIMSLCDMESCIIKKAAAKHIARFAYYAPSREILCIEMLHDIGIRWLDPTFVPSLVSAGLFILKCIAVRLQPERQINVFATIAKVCRDIKETRIAGRAVSALHKVLKVTTDESAKVAMSKIGYEVGIWYTKGELACLGGVPPQSTDIDFRLLDAFAKLISMLVWNRDGFLSNFIPFSCFLVTMKDYLRMEITAKVWMAAIRNKVLDKDESQYIMRRIDEVASADIPFELMLAECDMIISVVDSGYGDQAWLANKLPFIVECYHRCKQGGNKYRMAMSYVVYVMWRILMNDDTIIDYHDVFLDSFTEYPPNDFKRTARMSELLLSYFEKTVRSQDVCERGMVALLHVIAMSSLELRKRKLCEDIVQRVRRLVDGLCGLYDGQIQALVPRFFESRRKRN